MVNWGRFMNGNLVSYWSFMMDGSFMSYRSFMVDGSFMSHWSFMSCWYPVLGESFIVCYFLMVHRGRFMMIVYIFLMLWCIVMRLNMMAFVGRCLRVSPIVVIDWLLVSRQDFSSIMMALIVITVVSRGLMLGHLFVVVVDNRSGVVLNNRFLVVVSNLFVMSFDWVADVMIILLF